MPTYKLTYFPVKARAEPIRYLFHLSGVKFEDNIIDGQTFQELKPSLPLGQLPVLEVDGKQLPQSSAILRYVARQVGLYGVNDWDRAQADVVLDTLQEPYPLRMRIYHEKDEAKKAELRKTFEAEDLKENLEKLEKLLIQNEGGDGWFVGDNERCPVYSSKFEDPYNDERNVIRSDQSSREMVARYSGVNIVRPSGHSEGSQAGIADAACYSEYTDFLPFILGKKPDLSISPKFAALLKRFEELPQIAEYIKTRPASVM